MVQFQQLTDHEILMATQLVSSAESEQCWDDIGGHDELIKEITDTLILPLRLKSSSSSLLAPPKGKQEISDTKIRAECVVLYFRRSALWSAWMR